MDLAELLERQSGVVARRQLQALGLGTHDLRRLVRRRELTAVHRGVCINHTGALTWLQRAWAAVLAINGSALSHESAITAAERARHGQIDDGQIHIAVDRSRTVDPPPGVRRHYVTGLTDRVQWNASPPRVRIEHAVIDVAAGASDDFAAIALLAESVQRRRTTAVRLLSALDDRRRICRRIFLKGVLADIAAGTCSVLEHGYLDRVERAHGLPSGHRQLRDSPRGPVYRDVAYLPFATLLELDGRLFHDSTRQRDTDLDRDLDAAVDGRLTVRLGWGQVFDRPCLTARRVGRLLQQLGWTGVVSACPGCR